LPASNEKGHEIRLIVSDGSKEDSAMAAINVDAAHLPQYPSKRLGAPIKGICLSIGRRFSGKSNLPPSEDELHEYLDVIWRDLQCNSLRLMGDFDDTMLRCIQLSKNLGFKIIAASPRYNRANETTDNDIEAHVKNVIAFSAELEKVRGDSDSVVLVVGNELTIDVRGIYSGLSYDDRVKQISSNWDKTEYHERLNSYLKKILEGVRGKFGGRVTYASGTWEKVEWRQLGFDIVGSNLYFGSQWDTEESFTRNIGSLKKLGNSLFITEFGSAAFRGCGKWGGGAPNRWEGQEYSEEEQAKNIIRQLELYERSGSVDGVFLFDFVEKWTVDEATKFSIMRYFPSPLSPNIPQKPCTRKIGFYAYQSFIVG
jgi:hypothetical protein